MGYFWIRCYMCLAKPLEPQYNGGVVVNPQLNEGLKGWTTFGDAKIEHGQSNDGNKYIIASNRKQPFHSFSQKFNLEKDKLYTFSAWLQVSHGNADIAAIFKTNTSYETAGWVVAQKGCWSMLKGGLVVNVSGPAELYFEVRKTRVKFQAVDQHGQPIPNATISIINKRPNFPLGVAINKNILGNNAYQNWFTSRFKLTGLRRSKQRRGKLLDPRRPAPVRQAQWRLGTRPQRYMGRPKIPAILGLRTFPNDLRAVATHRTNAVVLRYRGQLIHWDVRARYIDRKMLPFLNEYNTIEEPGDGASSPAKYMQKIQLLRSQGYKGPLGIGLQGHFGIPNLPYVRSSIDFLASAGLPIWITELDVKPNPNQAAYLEQILRELHAHKAVRGILLWVAWSPQGCYTMCLTDNNFKNLATGDVVDKIRNEWSSAADLPGTTDSNGFFETSLFHGEYEAKISHPKGDQFSTHQKINLVPEEEARDVYRVQINV
ncbi:hypothetical protein DH2020_045468 [Rehmannia glutinosa]|uniref:GH10 domain-containing protein n=1 Tax=Rehmannia glutinosa TaxID=99300 RepID=A0ABR0UET2_REHGL